MAQSVLSMQDEHSFRPVLMAGVGIAILSCLDAAMKVVSAAYPLGEVVGLRFAAGSFFALVVFRAVREPRPTWAMVRSNLLRAGIMLLTAACFFTALARLPLAEAIALTFLAPLLLALLGRLILKEPVRPSTILALLAGLGGVLVIASGQENGARDAYDLAGIIAAVSCAFFYALSLVLMRQQTGTHSIYSIVLLTNLFVCAYVSPVMLWQWQTPGLWHAVIFASAGLLGTCGHLCLAWAYKRAPAGRLGILEYTAFLWASVLGFVFFNEVPKLATLAGAAIIVIACLADAWLRGKAMIGA